MFHNCVTPDIRPFLYIKHGKKTSMASTVVCFFSVCWRQQQWDASLQLILRDALRVIKSDVTLCLFSTCQAAIYNLHQLLITTARHQLRPPLVLCVSDTAYLRGEGDGRNPDIILKLLLIPLHLTLFSVVGDQKILNKTGSQTCIKHSFIKTLLLQNNLVWSWKEIQNYDTCTFAFESLVAGLSLCMLVQEEDTSLGRKYRKRDAFIYLLSDGGSILPKRCLFLFFLGVTWRN